MTAGPFRTVLGASWRTMLAVVTLLMLGAVPAAPSAGSVVYVIPVEGVIDLGLAPFVERVLDEAVVAGASAVILEIDTFGGRVDAAVSIRDTLIAAGQGEDCTEERRWEDMNGCSHQKGAG